MREGGGGLSQIFISYARSTEREAMAIAEALRGLGYGVWRDDELPAHRAYADVIAERLAAAKAVVVIWSAEAARSAWVRSEAEKARAEDKLVQLRLDDAVLPMPFDQVQCADLIGWTGDDRHPGWRKVADSVAALCGQSQDARATPAASRTKSICVLPFANLSGDAEQEYFSDGISEDIITDLSKVSALNVASRNSAFTFKGRSVKIPEVARELGVSHVLEGSVRKAGNRVRITAQLIEAATDTHLWAERYDRDLTDIFALQDEISQAIVAALKVKLAPAEKKAIERRGTESPEAYDLLLMARKLRAGANTSARTEENTVDLCRRALAIDPDYAQAWSLLGAAQGGLFHRFGHVNDAGAAAVEKALALDPNLGDAHALRARELQRAGRLDEAFAELDLAVRLDPDSYEVNNRAGDIYYLVGRFADAVPHFEKAAAASEADIGCLAMMQSALEALGDAEGARRAARRVLERAEKTLAEDQSNGYAFSLGVVALAAQGEHARARQWIDRALLIDPDNVLMRYNFACALSLYLDDADGAIALLGPTLTGPHTAEYLKMATSDPDLGAIRGDPRFQALLAEAEARAAQAEIGAH